MSAAKSKRLQLVARLAELREQQQLVRLQQSRQQQQQQLASLQRLQGFQNDYAQNGVTVAKGDDAQPVVVSELQNFSRFINDLSAAEQIQRQQLAQADAICKDNDQAWITLHARRQRLQELVDKYLAQETQLAETLADRENEDRWNGLKQSLKS